MLQLLYNSESYTPYVKDAFHRYLINGEKDAIQPKEKGTKVAGYYKLKLAPGESQVIKCRLMVDGEELKADTFSKKNFDDVFELRKAEACHFYYHVLPGNRIYSHKNVAIY